MQLPSGKYNTIVIDPPWPVHLAFRSTVTRHKRAKRLPYRTMTVEEIKEIPMSQVGNPGAHIYLWTTNGMLRAAFEVFDAWGVDFHLVIPMVKTSGIAPNMGYVFGSEFCLLGFLGKPVQKFKRIGELNWLKTNPSPNKHSKKPDAFYAKVERMSPGPYLDLFSRQRRHQWASWGDQLPPEAPVLDTYTREWETKMMT